MRARKRRERGEWIREGRGREERNERNEGRGERRDKGRGREERGREESGKREREKGKTEGERGNGEGKEDWISQMSQVGVIFPVFEYMGTLFCTVIRV